MTRPSHSDAARLEGEAAFHDQAFGHHTRERAWPFYEVASDAYERYAALLDEAVSPSSAVLEYGCGPGSHAFQLARLGARVDGIDISHVAIGLARQTALAEDLARSTSFAVMDAEHLAFADDSFDLVCGTSIIHHLDVRRAYAEVARVLRPTGTAVFLEALGHNPAINAYRRRTPALRTPDEHPLRMDDVAVAGDYFTKVYSEHFALLSLAALAIRRRSGFVRASAALQRADRTVFRVAPSLQRWSWMTVITLAGPCPAG